MNHFKFEETFIVGGQVFVLTYTRTPFTGTYKQQTLLNTERLDSIDIPEEDKEYVVVHVGDEQYYVKFSFYNTNVYTGDTDGDTTE